LTEPARLIDEGEQWVAALARRGLISEPVAAALREAFVQSRNERLDAPEDPLLVAMLCGPTAVGKSSLINALAGAEISRPGLGAETPAASIYVHERDDPARLFEYSQVLGRLGRAEASLIRHARDDLLHKVLVDTPDIDSAVRRHRETTAVLVHCADLVLFVTSPEKYKTMQGAAWITEQRQQRAIAFVLNKWDRDALGLQYVQRERLENDFRAVLAQVGFTDPLVFKVSSLVEQAHGGVGGIENELPRLAAWLSAGLDRSLAGVIQQRRQRAAWGRLSVSLASAVPTPIDGGKFVGQAREHIARGRAQSVQLVKCEASLLASVSLEASNTRPSFRGLLGGWMRLADRVGHTAQAVRALFRSRGPTGILDNRTFGEAAAALLARVTGTLAEKAVADRLPLGVVAAGWVAESRGLSERLAELPAEVEAELASAVLRPSLRRGIGIGVLYAIEVLLELVLLLAVWRLGSGFLSGDYVSSGLLLNTAALLIVLLLLGNVAANLLFGPLQERLRRTAAKRAETVVAVHWERAAMLLEEQIEATDRLAQQGGALTTEIDRIVQSLAPVKRADGDVAQLFGEETTGAARRQSVFE
jgi:energy-coupling factor transporter ATP-binding protein EcfA2